MPMYEFFCPSCGLQFEELVESEKVDTLECKDCGDQAEKKNLSDFGFQFDSGKMEDGTIGVDSVDNDVDKIIGRDSKRRWEQIKDRESRKRKAARSRANDESVPMKRVSEKGEYEVLSDEELKKTNYLHKQKEEYKKQTEEKEKKEEGEVEE